MRRILITGANQGLGLALSKLYLQGEETVFAGVHSASSEVESLTEQFPDRYHAFDLEVTEETAVRTFRDRVAKHTDRLDVIINNAGILIRETVDNQIEELDFENMERTFQVNTFGPLRVIKYFLPMLYRGKEQIIANISSRSGCISECTDTSWYDYCGSKAALNMASKILQNYLKDKKIKALAIHPGWVRSRMGGPQAAISPEESATGIISLLERKWTVDDPIYFDYTGRRMPW
jgi:NAD(P)-dependent dehydrogenase (short-subunit alcohol dehydrogenase family)